MAHDLTRPINTIQLLSSILKKELNGEKFDEIKRYFRIIDDTCNSSIDLITRLVNNELLLSTKVDLVKDRIDIVEKINNLVEVYKWSHAEIGKTFSVISSENKIFIVADEVKLLQAVNNLIANSIKFTRENGHISITINNTDSTLLIIVKDDGVGIPVHLHPFLFDKFTRAARVGLKGEKTVGLGMSITKTIVELHGGKIWFDSEENKGSAFYISIPCTE
ncbi:MAG TPA: HAMP domain-containing sensor histidine kinase [Cytophagales bacterium]|nr:HAMP domain-containing sensor histidine kinase [Cytophagales bacterium]